MSEHTVAFDSPWPHRLAVAMCCATFPLIWVGGLVTTHQAGMAVPDWPGTYGYNLFLYPLSTWLAGPFDLFIEHGHRLLAASVGLIAIGFVLSVFCTPQSKATRILAVLALIGVCMQGALGGMRVLLDERTLAMVHACLGPSFFAFTVALAALTSRPWKSAATPVCSLESGRIQRLAVFTSALAFLQLVLGAQLRHTPVDAGIGFFRAALYFHLLVAVALIAHSLLLMRVALRGQRATRSLQVPSLLLAGLVLLQILLGGASWIVKYGFPRWVGDHAWTAGFTVTREDLFSSLIVTSHVAIGSSILAISLLIALRAFRFLKADHSAVALRSGMLLEVTA